jgi:hypothetical protein
MGWKKIFKIDIISSPTLFAMMCAAGWIVNNWFPKGTFTVSDAFIERVSCQKS